MVGPVAFLDVIGPERLRPGQLIDVPEHPHIGLSTLTYLFDGRLVHRDSTGAHQVIDPGDVNWMTAGSGVTHIERSHPDDVDVEVVMRGVQIWVALPLEKEDAEPFFSHTGMGELPAEQRGAAAVRLVAGSGWGLVSPVPVSSPMVLADVVLDGSGSLTIDDEHSERAALVMEGNIEAAGQSIAEGHLAVFEPGTSIEIGGRGRVLVLGGAPVGERHISWNFVHSNKEAIERAHARWEAGEFARTPNVGPLE